MLQSISLRLAALYTALFALAVGLALQDCWFREVQVLPSRTHPVMQMNHGGGYLLSGTTVMPGGAQQQQG